MRPGGPSLSARPGGLSASGSRLIDRPGAAGVSRRSLEEPSASQASRKDEPARLGDYTKVLSRMQGKLHALSKIARFYTDADRSSAFRNACRSGRRSGHRDAAKPGIFLRRDTRAGSPTSEIQNENPGRAAGPSRSSRVITSLTRLPLQNPHPPPVRAASEERRQQVHLAMDGAPRWGTGCVGFASRPHARPRSLPASWQ